MSALAAMRAFFQRDLRRVPFVFTLTDLHKAISSLTTIGILHVWLILNGPGVDQIVEDKFDVLRKELTAALRAEEAKAADTASPGSTKWSLMSQLSDIMQKSWEIGTFRYTLAPSPIGLCSIFYKRIQPLLSERAFELWGRDVVKVFTIRSTIEASN
ncbi:hypothetical protein AJ80_06764 [Polytolypa hystricis UAMH7299]|uniref:Uncharacterized protein n=1 Tax=Polytolypa hystricis (strain UAMH7299) TaxID=1447883 RepID=A0A2B7XKT2_POLH7|nr:hypothetical protein AJ80_06764 [Polytolypa hystricis UAMH7299]